MTATTRTTTTRTRKNKKTRKKDGVKAKTRRGKKSGGAKKPTWSLITFKQIEEWRQKLGLSKSGMAEALQVTNSTYHNWRRGTTVPHSNQQEDILQRIQALKSSSAEDEAVMPVEVAENEADSRPADAEPTASTPTNGTGRPSVSDSPDSNGSGAKRNDSAGSESTHQGRVPPCNHPSTPNVPRKDIAAITVAYIQSQEGPISAGSVYEFVKGLREVL